MQYHKWSSIEKLIKQITHIIEFKFDTDSPARFPCQLKNKQNGKKWANEKRSLLLEPQDNIVRPPPQMTHFVLWCYELTWCCVWSP